ncbi:MAG: N utilization substance protein B [Arcticibacterium sp.]|jgi:N utilization substance protein B
MLNRRLIRIRAMQSLYAYEQSRKANFLLAQDLIHAEFAPDLNSMEFQDKVKLQGLSKLALQQLADDFSIYPTEDDFEQPIQVKNIVKEASDFYVDKNRIDYQGLVIRVIKEADKVFDMYAMLLGLYLALAEMAEKDKTFEGKSKLGSNKLLKELKENKALELMIIRQSFRWETETDFLKSLYNQVLKVNAKYIEYCSKRNHTLEEEIALLKYMVKNIFLKNGLSSDFFEKEHLYWSEDKETLRAMVAHTFQNYEQSGLNIASPDEAWQERKDFLLTLFKNSIVEEKELMQHIMPSLKNWEYERIAETDKVLLKMALVEMKEFSAIPIKVTINEIIEIAKEYSTPKSGLFVNGVLDKLSKLLVVNGEIKKSGRGMLDNK